jgi:hypothetical protein
MVVRKKNIRGLASLRKESGYRPKNYFRYPRKFTAFYHYTRSVVAA